MHVLAWVGQIAQALAADHHAAEAASVALLAEAAATDQALAVIAAEPVRLADQNHSAEEREPAAVSSAITAKDISVKELPEIVAFTK